MNLFQAVMVAFHIWLANMAKTLVLWLKPVIRIRARIPTVAGNIAIVSMWPIIPTLEDTMVLVMKI